MELVTELIYNALKRRYYPSSNLLSLFTTTRGYRGYYFLWIMYIRKGSYFIIFYSKICLLYQSLFFKSSDFVPYSQVSWVRNITFYTLSIGDVYWPRSYEKVHNGIKNLFIWVKVWYFGHVVQWWGRTK